MKIRFLTIEHERMEDAPFIGALISAINCSRNCKNCFNQHLKQLPIQELEVNDIIEIIKNNKLNQGIILGGLEWTEQPQEMIKLIKAAQLNELEIMLYTGMNEKEFKKKFPQLKNIWVKVGEYIEELKTDNNIQYGVKLATSNQKIIKIT